MVSTLATVPFQAASPTMQAVQFLVAILVFSRPIPTSAASPTAARSLVRTLMASTFLTAPFQAASPTMQSARFLVVALVLLLLATAYYQEASPIAVRSREAGLAYM